MSQQSQNLNAIISAEIFSSYFSDKDSALLQKYANDTFIRLQEGHIASNVNEADIKGLQQSKYVCDGITKTDKPFVLFNNKLYLQRYFLYETKIVDKIKGLQKQGETLFPIRKQELEIQKAFIQTLFADFESKGSPEEQINWQLTATLNSALQQFSIITGGPGTGKTTTVAKLLALLYTLNPDTKVTLVAQTGKASARLKESLNNSKKKLAVEENIKTKFDKIQPSTIHRLLGYIPNSIDFRHNSTNTLDYDVIIVDESSMIDVPLMAKLFDAVDINTRIILLGDKNQLASVEAGSIFGDLCKSTQEEMNLFTKERITFFNSFITDGQISTTYIDNTTRFSETICELKKSYRFAGEEGIGVFSKSILNGKSIDFDTYKAIEKDEGVCIRKDLQTVEINHYLDKFESYIEEEDTLTALQKLNEVKLLCATRKSSYGVHELNLRVQQYLSEKGLINSTEDFYINRPILITKNDYNLGLYNGDIGICRKNKDNEIRIFFEHGENETGLKEIIPAFVQSFETVFAMTIHKSQGSEFNHVLIILPPEGKSEAIFTRELVYTGITRAKRTVLLITEETVLQQAIDTPVKRVSGIIERI